MGGREFGFSFRDEPVFTYIQQDAPYPSTSELEEDFFVYVMGPYTAFDATYVYLDGGELESPFIEDPLFDPDLHLTSGDAANFQSALEDLCHSLREEFGVRAFIATDIDIPTDSEAGDGEESMSVPEQSIAFAAVSDAVIFLFSPAGLTTGVGAEVGFILGEFHLRRGNPEPLRKPRERFRIFTTGDFSSATIDEIPFDYGVDTIRFDTKDDLIRKIQNFLANIERRSTEGPFPIFTPHPF